MAKHTVMLNRVNSCFTCPNFPLLSLHPSFFLSLVPPAFLCFYRSLHFLEAANFNLKSDEQIYLLASRKIIVFSKYYSFGVEVLLYVSSVTGV